MLEITKTISIPESEIGLRFVRAAGPGGQNVNKVATAVQLRFDVRRSQALPAEVRDRLAFLAGARISKRGVLVIDARRFRTQARNRQDALERLARLIRRAAEKPKTHRRTEPTRASQLKRLEAKKRRGRLKQVRQEKAKEEE